MVGVCVCAGEGRTDEFEPVLKGGGGGGGGGGESHQMWKQSKKEQDKRQSASALRQQTPKQAVKPRQTILHAVAHGNVPTRAYCWN